MREVILPLGIGTLLASSMPAWGQSPIDRSDPTIAERSLPRAAPQQPQPELLLDEEAQSYGAKDQGDILPMAIMVEGSRVLPPTAFADVITRYSGRSLSPQDLAELAGAVANVARAGGYPFASATIEPQSIENGVLKVTLDEGEINAVRVLGAKSLVADQILNARLATGKPIRRDELERAILLVEDLPGVTVRQSQFVKQDGFGILLVTIERDRFSSFVQLDNRGSPEVGPIRSTILANLRELAKSGDELSFILAQTPVEPSEFNFIRGRYAVPVDRNGSTLAAFASYGKANPGASLKALDVGSRSTDFGISYRRPVLRTLSDNVAVSLELRRVHTKQDIAGIVLRDERLTLVNGAIEAINRAAGGTLRTELRATAGIELGRVSHEGDARLSRSDGDARFVTLGYAIDWQRSLGGGLGVSLSSAGQLASRPLLATAEIGVGGPSFARAYEYSERSGDRGILGSAEVQYDLRNRPFGLLQRVQIFASLDGGAVANLRGGRGGGSLVSSSIGVRLGKGSMSLATEVAFPLSADRFDTGGREPRVSVRLSKSF